MNFSLPSDLSPNPFNDEFLLSEAFPFSNPTCWTSIVAPRSIFALHDDIRDSLLTIRRIIRALEPANESIIYSPHMQSDNILEAIAHDAANWWIRYLASDISPLFTMHPTDELLLLRLLVWSQGSIEAVEYALRVQYNANEKYDHRREHKRYGKVDDHQFNKNIRRFLGEFQRKETKVIGVGVDNLKPHISWAALRPLGYDPPQLIVVSTQKNHEGPTAALRTWADEYPNLIVKLFLAADPLPLSTKVPIVVLKWKVDDLEAMVNEAVGRVFEGRAFHDLYDTNYLTEELQNALGGQSLLRFLADQANGSIAKLMTYCNAILQAYRERMKQPGGPPGAISRTDVMSVLDQFGLKNYDHR